MADPDLRAAERIIPANLLAANPDLRTTLNNIKRDIATALRAEREACATVAEDEAQNSSGASRGARSPEEIYERACRTIAEAIRARGGKG